ncbi:MAG TPA: S-methyl-5-thioribose-1-phosphate isomerase, partial [Planctomycetota bacterium]
PIEERAAAEIRGTGDSGSYLPGVAVSNPAFDVTPAALVRALITERGVLPAPDRERLAAHLGG